MSVKLHSREIRSRERRSTILLNTFSEKKVKFQWLMGTLAARWMSWHLWIDWEMEGDKSKCKKAFSCGCAEWMGVTAIIDVHLEVEIAISPWNIHRLLRNMAGNLTGWKIQRNTDLRGYFIGQDWLIFAALNDCSRPLWYYFILFVLSWSASSALPLKCTAALKCLVLYLASWVKTWGLHKKERPVDWLAL